jgi:hypothetical protein
MGAALAAANRAPAYPPDALRTTRRGAADTGGTGRPARRGGTNKSASVPRRSAGSARSGRTGRDPCGLSYASG